MIHLNILMPCRTTLTRPFTVEEKLRRESAIGSLQNTDLPLSCTLSIRIHRRSSKEHVTVWCVSCISKQSCLCKLTFKSTGLPIAMSDGTKDQHLIQQLSRLLLLLQVVKRSEAKKKGGPTQPQSPSSGAALLHPDGEFWLLEVSSA